MHALRVERPDESPPPAAPAGKKSALAFMAVLLALLLPALLAQQASPALGLALTELGVFLYPAAVGVAGSNLRLAPYLRLRPVPPGVLALGFAAGAAGFFAGGAVMSVTQLLEPRGWVESFDATRIFETAPWERWSLAALATLVAPVCEELTFRGYVQTTVGLRRPPAVAIAVAALLFALLHLDPVRFPALVFLGALFGWLAWRSGSIWPSVAAHATNNGIAAAVLLFGGEPDRGAARSAGELAPALVLGVFGVLALAALVVRFRAATPAPPPPSASLVLVDPASPSIAWRPARVPPRLALAAVSAFAALLLLALAGLTPAAR